MPGVVGNTNAVATSQVGSIKSVVNTASGITAILTSANPAGAVLTAAGTVANLLSNLNHPYGTCAPNAPDSDSFLACWKHPLQDNSIPAFGPPSSTFSKTQGWGFAYCPGARNGRAPVNGCQPGCNCSGRPCACAPTGAVKGLPDGSFIDAAGNNLGPATTTSEVGQTIKPSNPISLGSTQTGQLGTTIGSTGAVVPYSQTSQNRIPGETPDVGTSALGGASISSLGTGLTIFIVIAIGLALTLSFFSQQRRR